MTEEKRFEIKLDVRKRSNDSVFKIAHKRNVKIKQLSKEQFHKHLIVCKRWSKDHN